MTVSGKEVLDPIERRIQLERKASADFFDASMEWQRLFSEGWGTFLLVVVAAGASVVAAESNGAVTLAMAVTAPGLMVMAIIYFMGTISGAHLNPVVTLAFALRGNFPWNRVPLYVVAQLLGGIAAATFLRAMFAPSRRLARRCPAPATAADRRWRWRSC